MTHITGVEPPQILLFPEAVDDYASADNPVRFIDGFVDELDLAAAGIARVAPKAAGRPGYAPSDLLKPHIYGYLNRVWSGHQLEIECSHNIEIIWLLAEKVAQIQEPTIAHPQIRKFLELTRKAAQPPLNLPIKDAVDAFLSYAEKRCAPDSTDDWRVMLSEELIHHAKCIRVDAKHGNGDAYEPSLLHAEKIIRKIYSAPQMLDAAEPYFTELAAAKPDFSGTQFVSLIQFALKHPNRADSSRQVERVANLINAYATELHEQYHAAYRLLDQAVTTLAALIPYVHGTAQGVALQNLYSHAYNLIVTRNQVPSDHATGALKGAHFHVPQPPENDADKAAQKTRLKDNKPSDQDKLSFLYRKFELLIDRTPPHNVEKPLSFFEHLRSLRFAVLRQDASAETREAFEERIEFLAEENPLWAARQCFAALLEPLRANREYKACVSPKIMNARCDIRDQTKRAFDRADLKDTGSKAKADFLRFVIAVCNDPKFSEGVHMDFREWAIRRLPKLAAVIT
jgi:transposase